jgi:anti-anti-sigma regulatory factor/ribosomal protein S27AE
MTRLTARVDGSRIVLAGRIDDTAQLVQLAERVPAGDVAIDTDAVTFVNSVGMRELIRLVRALKTRGRIAFERVADVLVAQVNLVPELARSVTVVSFHAPYECPRCGAEHAPLVDVRVHAELLYLGVAPHLPCPECGAPSALADFPERYLGIFKT